MVSLTGLESKKVNYWEQAIDKVESIYNNQEHSALGMSPNEVDADYEALLILEAQAKTRRLRQKDKFQMGDIVRIPIAKDLFSKWGINFSKELYEIT